MNKNIVAYILNILGYLGIVVLGIIFIVEANVAVPFLWLGFLILLGVYEAGLLYGLIIKRQYKNLPSILFAFIIMGVIYAFPVTYNRFIGLIVGLYALLNAIINFVEYQIRRKEKLNGIIGKLFLSIIFLIFALILFVVPYYGVELTFVIAGIYNIVYGLINLIFAFLEIVDHRKFGLSLPVIISALLPLRVFMRIKSDDAIMSRTISDPDDDSDEAPLCVNIYIQESGFESFGHVDVSIGDTIYSYGLHDPKDRYLLGSAGKGVLVEVNKKAFLKNCLKSGKTMIISYEIYPDDKELAIIKKRLADLLKDAYPFKCDARLEEEKGEAMKADDYISDVYKDTRCHLYKFKRGKFKTYFVFTTNCVLLTDYLIRNKEINLFDMSGIITPGTYLNFLYQLYLDPDSIVKGIKIYKLS